MINKIKIARMEKKLTQAELAKQIGATRQTIGLIEKGEYNPSLQLCIAIAKSLGKTLDDLFWEDETND
ncbi:helix-turn-helix transcriptional regulator [Sporosarcina sp. 6E9]|uniref:helix-turn-helix transcriptional regulator n=1 Tax=Sporosarcina sp. 6E9 TaxID=2819235 RepID=UPI001B3002D6|nr:helix-turn-helix transcriptional regulator [Sporosarcina sp. 6E9]